VCFASTAIIAIFGALHDFINDNLTTGQIAEQALQAHNYPRALVYLREQTNNDVFFHHKYLHTYFKVIPQTKNGYGNDPEYKNYCQSAEAPRAEERLVGNYGVALFQLQENNYEYAWKTAAFLPSPYRETIKADTVKKAWENGDQNVLWNIYFPFEKKVPEVPKDPIDGTFVLLKDPPDYELEEHLLHLVIKTCEEEIVAGRQAQYYSNYIESIISWAASELYRKRSPIDAREFLERHGGCFAQWPFSAWIMGRPFLYVMYRIISYAKDWFTPALIPLLLTALLWLYFLHKIDIFEPEKIKYLLLTMAIMIPAIHLLHFKNDWIYMVIGFDSDESFFHHIVSMFCKVAFFEELVKILPVLVILYRTNEINEPVDFIVYGSVSGLAFAVIENINYIDGSAVYGLLSIRSLLCVFGHMSYSAIAAYGIMLVKYKKRAWWNIPCYFFLADSLHAVYNCFVSTWWHSMYFAGILLDLFCTLIYVRLLGNSLGESDFYFSGITDVYFPPFFKKFSILLGFIPILDFGYFILRFGYDNITAEHSLQIVIFYMMIFLFLFSMNSLIVKKGETHKLLE